MIAPTTRFSNRVADYVRTRPGYPPGVLDILRSDGLTSTMTIADVGSGTGLSAQLFLANGNTVCGVEPNREMREAGEQFLAHYPNFRSIVGTAEATTLPTEKNKPKPDDEEQNQPCRASNAVTDRKERNGDE